LTGHPSDCRVASTGTRNSTLDNEKRRLIKTAVGAVRIVL
jgi:hypothetical protein